MEKVEEEDEVIVQREGSSLALIGIGSNKE